MAKSPKNQPPEGDPVRGDAILKRMLQSKPKTHKEMIKRPNKPRTGSTKQ